MEIALPAATSPATVLSIAGPVIDFTNATRFQVCSSDRLVGGMSVPGTPSRIV
jgi:hypothetical protein